MSPAPPLRYARRRGAHIAYQIVGSGPLDVIVFGTGTAPIESLWELPAAAEFLERLSGFSRLILFDRRGIGSSDPIAPDESFDEQGHASDAVAVMAAVGARDVVAIGLGLAAGAAICLAADRPEEVSRLVLWNATARQLIGSDYPIGREATMVDSSTEIVIWGDTDQFLTVVAPSALEDPAYRRWYEQAGRRGASPAVAESLFRSLLLVDVRSRLHEIRAPTLILHSEENWATPLAHAEYLAERIADSRVVPLPGADGMPFVGEFHRVSEEIEEFVTGVRRERTSSHRIATVMFTDIVDSTSLAAKAGDQEWREVMDRHDGAVEAVVERFGGAVVKSTGDGQLATFGTPSSALRAGSALVQATQNLGLSIRVGIHLGEIEARGNDVTGLAVNVAARVCDHSAAGEVWLTDSTRRAALGSGHSFEMTGNFDLKGVPEQWELHRLVP